MSVPVLGEEGVRQLGASEQLAGVVEVIEQLSFAHDLPAITRIVATAARRILGADGVTFVLREGDHCYYADEEAISPLWKGQRFPLHLCISGWTMLTGTTAVIEDIYADSRIPHDAYRPTFVRSLVMTPVRPEEPIAAIGAYWASRHRATAEEVSILRTIARSTALAIVNAEQVRGLRAAAEAARAQAAEREALLREVHHRVKNNFQMLCDMLYLQMEALGGVEHAGVLRDTYGRIYAIARLHEQLYQSMESGQVKLREYLRTLASGLNSVYPNTAIRIQVPPDAIRLDVDRAIHAGLIANELVTNAVKHAFPDGRTGEVLLRLDRVGDQVRLQVQDNGTGLPAGLDLAQTKSLGLRIVRILSQRLGAALDVEQAGGTTFTLTFPLAGEPPREPATR